MWIWEQLRQKKPDLIARYFRAKRRLIDPKKFKKYTADDCVAVLSIAASQGRASKEFPVRLMLMKRGQEYRAGQSLRIRNRVRPGSRYAQRYSPG